MPLRRPKKPQPRPARELRADSSFRFGLRFELFYLTTLLLDLLLLRIELRLRLRLLSVPVLHLIADQEAARRADRAADRSARTRRADRRSDYRTRAGPDQSADTGALLTRTERLPRASDHPQRHHCRDYDCNHPRV
jgi:hypothetical protein